MAQDIIEKSAEEARDYAHSEEVLLPDHLQAISNNISGKTSPTWLAEAVLEEAMNRGIITEDDYCDLAYALS